METSRLSSILRNYGYDLTDVRLEPIEQGYINSTFRLRVTDGPDRVLQQLNTSVFRKPEVLLENLVKVLPHLNASDYEAIELISTTQGDYFYRDSGGSYWRMLSYVNNSITTKQSNEVRVAREAGRIIGRFHQLVAGLDPYSFDPVIECFHDLDFRMGQFAKARQTATSERLKKASTQIAEVAVLAAACSHIQWEDLPIRLCHNDTKLSNILFDKDTSQALCLVDLDTVMPGYLLFDIGDALRILICPGDEDQKEAIGDLRPDFFKAFCEGINASQVLLTKTEKINFADAPLLMSLLHGIRALTDYLEGDQYYKVNYPDQNLVRASNLLGTAARVNESLPVLRKLAREVLI